MASPRVSNSSNRFVAIARIRELQPLHHAGFTPLQDAVTNRCDWDWLAVD